LIALCSIAFVVAASFLIFDLDDKFYPRPKEHAASIDYIETPNQTLIPESTPEPAPEIKAQKQSQPLQKQSIRAQIEPKSRLTELEQKQFQLNLGGDVYMSGMLKKASLILKLVPAKGTDLQQFHVTESRLILDNSGTPITCTGVQIDGKKITIGFTANNVGAFSISGMLDESILDDANNKQNVILEDQDFYLIKKETPYRLNLIGRLSS